MAQTPSCHGPGRSASPGARALDRRVEAVRHFNRDYTRRIGVLREGLLDSPFSLTQARVLYELAYREQPDGHRPRPGSSGWTRAT